jgi:hypothetical protein
MGEILLTQDEADALIAMEKHRINSDRSEFPQAGTSLVIQLQSADSREQFLLDLSRGRIDLRKVKLQNRGRQTIVLVRIDLGGAPHRNPDDMEIGVPHMHVYREGYGDSWAEVLPPEWFRNPSDVWTTLEDFMIFCNITSTPNIQRELFT